MKTIDIVLPAYREQEGIEAFNESLFRVLEPLNDRYRFTVTYVLDPSPDDTFDILKKLAKSRSNIVLVQLSRRFGHQMSLVAGIDRSRGDAVIMMDCDEQHPPDIVPTLLEKFEEGYDVVNTVRQYNADTGVFKRSTSRLFYRVQNALSPVELSEGAADFRLISRKVAAVFQNSIREQNQFLRGLFQWVGFRTATISFVSNPRAAGITKYDLRRLLAFATSGILSFSKLPLRVASIVGLVISVISLIYGIALILYYFLVSYVPRGYTSLIVLVLFMGGLQLVVLGILGEYLGGIFDEVKGRPLYVIDEVIQGESL
jgi:glycosyltransferase involved in cell wall biosynthesis